MPQYNWKSVDWSLKDKEIARLLGASYAAVHYQRAKHKKQRWKHYTDWSVINWTKSNNEIALATGRPVVSVCKARRRYAPEAIKPRRAPISREKWLEVDWTRSSGDIAAELGCSVSSVSNARKRLGLTAG